MTKVTEEVKRNQPDLVICPHYSFENRWGSNPELVDYAVVERWNPIRLQMNNSSLKRVKICRLHREPKMALLRNLERYHQLRQLELDRLELDQPITTFALNMLVTLHIDSIIVVDAADDEVPRARAVAKFDSSVLKILRLGKYPEHCEWFCVITV